MAWKPDISSLEGADARGGGARTAAASEDIRVLIVDDSEAVRDGLALLLNSRPYCRVVGAVDDPHSAMAAVRHEEPHVVLLDFSMPLVDPLALAAQLATCSPRPAVLMLSALANEHSAARANAAGAVGWVLKDAEPEALFTALLRAARSADPGWEAPPALAAEVLGHSMAANAPVAGGAPADDAGDHAGAAGAGGTAGDVAKKLEARTVRALLLALRAVRGDLMGATVEDLAAHAVVSPRTAERLLKRLLCREPPLVALVGADASQCRYVLTEAGEQELDRLGRHIAAEAAFGDAA